MSDDDWRVLRLERETRRLRVIAWVAVLLHVPWMAAGITMVALRSGVVVVQIAPSQDAELAGGPSTADVLPAPVDPPSPPSPPAPSVEPAAPAEPPPPTIAPAEPPPPPQQLGRTKKATTTALVEEGWSFIEQRNNRAAENTFRHAIDEDPTNAEAQLGYAYALLRNDKSSVAKDHLCRALRLSGGDIELQREAEGLLRKHELSCR